MNGRHLAAPGPVRRAWTDLVRLVLPVSCAGCGAPDVPLCDRCRAVLPVTAHRADEATAPGAPPVWSAGAYTGPLRQVLVQVKDEGRHDLLPVLAGCAAHAVRAAWYEAPAPVGEQVLLVPVPSSSSAVRRRGVDVTARTACLVAAALRRRGYRVAVARVLRQRAGVLDQAGLGVVERVHNVSSALHLRRGARVDGRTVLLLDDVVTTGATLAAAAAAIGDAGARVLGGATVAATARRVPLPGTAPSGVGHRRAGLSGPWAVD